MIQPCNEFECPVNCQLSDWSGWSKCSKDCGGGVEGRVRDVVIEADHNGMPCDELQESRQCNVESCDADCTLHEWSEWTGCSKVCNGGKQFRHKHVDMPARGMGTCISDEDPTRVEEKSCNPEPC